MKIAAFNTKKLGWAKVHKNVVRKILIKIMSRYSVVVLLEVLDQTGKAMEKLLDELNGDNGQHQYNMICSESLGRSSYKEKFVFFYRVHELSIIAIYQYREKGEDVLAREPFVVLFRRLNAGVRQAVQELALIPVHTKPEDAERELDAMVKVVDAVKKRLKTENIMILGDFNADGRYLSGKGRQRVGLSSQHYHWLIDDDVDTTTSDCNDHTYDRIVVYGQVMVDAVVPDSAQPFNFQRAYQLSDQTAQAISDHYPVEVELK
nr:deoxyribonuclease-1-like isoform X2 [Scatophagus argus]